MLSITALSQAEKDPTEETLESLATYLDFRSLIEVTLAPSGRYSKSSFPGYLETQVETRSWYIPCHLGSVFPEMEVCEKIAVTAKSISVDQENSLCLSGSATFLGRLGEIGDLDFCEYAIVNQDRLAARACQKVHFRHSTRLVEIKCEKERFCWPWPNIEMSLSKAVSGDNSPRPARPMKLDFIAETGLGVLPVTSVILPLGNDRETGNAKLSHAFQEAVIAGDGPVRALHNLSSFGGYTQFLLKEAEDLLAGLSGKPKVVSTIKALKRLLSYVLLLGEYRSLRSKSRVENYGGVDREI